MAVLKEIAFKPSRTRDRDNLLVAVPGVESLSRSNSKSLADALGEADVEKRPAPRQGPSIMPSPKGKSSDRHAATKVVKPEDPLTWPPRLYLAYKQVARGANVPRAKLEEFLKLMGHRTVWDDLVHHACSGFPKSLVYTPMQAYEFVQLYEQRIHADLQRAFTKRASADSLLPFAMLEELVSELGYTPVPSTLSELLDEAAKAVTGEGLEDEDAITMPIFERFVEMLVENEGFSASEAHVLERTFHRFDRDGSQVIEAEEFPDILLWLGFCSDVHIVRRLIEEAQSTASNIDLERFMILMRKHRAEEYSHTTVLFDLFDENADGLIEPGHMSGLFRRLGVSLLPDALIECVEDLSLSYEDFTFTCVWKVLQLVRQREGFCSAELKEISDAFRRYDREHTGELLSRSVPSALRWLGYNVAKNSKKVMEWRRGYGQRGKLTEREFMKIVRDHAEADLWATRAAFREYALNQGSLPLPFNRLKRALRKVNGSYDEYHEAWIIRNMPHKWIRRKRATFDFEDFRRIATGCRLAMRDRLRALHGFLDKEITVFRINFVGQLAKQGHGSKTLSPAGLVVVFQEVCPAIKTSTDVRNMLKKALLINEVGNRGLTWDEFLKVMRTYEDLAEQEDAAGAPLIRNELNIPAWQVDDVLDVFRKYLREGPNELSCDDMRCLYHAGTKVAYSPALLARPSSTSSTGSGKLRLDPKQPPLSDEQAEGLRDRLMRLQEKQGAAGSIPKFIKFCTELRSSGSQYLGDGPGTPDSGGTPVGGGSMKMEPTRSGMGLTGSLTSSQPLMRPR